MQYQRSPEDVETIELVPIGETGNRQPRSATVGERLLGWLAASRWFLLLVALPSAIGALYFGLVAADRYESEAQFVVRSPGGGAGPLTGLVQSPGITRSSDDAFVVHAYLRSRDAVRKLASERDLIARLGRPEADLLWHYPPPWRRHSDEQLWRHFQSLLAIDYDATTGISTLRVQAFLPADAKEIAEALLQSAEDLINRLSERSQTDAVRMAEREVAETRAKARAALDAITGWRRRHAVVDPNQNFKAALETITRLAVDIAQTNAQLAQLAKASPDSPQATALRQRIAAFAQQIEQERAALAGSDRSLAPLLAEYEELVLERDFAERSFGSAQSALDMARIDAERQRLFLERISTPVLADYPKHPARLYGFLSVLGLSWLVYAIGRLLIADTRSHAGQ